MNLKEWHNHCTAVKLSYLVRVAPNFCDSVYPCTCFSIIVASRLVVPLELWYFHTEIFCLRNILSWQLTKRARLPCSIMITSDCILGLSQCWDRYMVNVPLVRVELILRLMVNIFSGSNFQAFPTPELVFSLMKLGYERAELQYTRY